jgi:peptidoglycan hydrolase-like protein with peptidoglycan-binding domain
VSDRDRVGRLDQWMDGGGWVEPPARERDLPTPLPVLEPGRERRAPYDRRRIAAVALGALALLVAAVSLAVLRGGDEDAGDRPPAVSTVDTGAAGTAESPPSIQLSTRQVVQAGDSGRHVRRLQVALNTLGYTVGRADGVFGPRTANQLRRFQRDARLAPDGVAGRRTLRALNTALARG